MTRRKYNNSYSTLLLCAAALVAAAQTIHAQSSMLGTNLIVNGNAEAGPASPDGSALVASIPSWTRATGNANVLPYGLTGFVLLSNPAPPDHSFQYFAAQGGPATLTQVINVSSGASTISGGNVKYTVSAYLGSTRCCATAQLDAAFQNASGQTFATATLSPTTFSLTGMLLQQQIGLVPAGTTQIKVTLTLSNQFSAADSLSLVFSTLGTNPSSVLGTNLIVNGGAEAGASAPPQSVTAYIPNWPTNQGASVCPYGGTGWIQTSDPGPADRGVNLFCGASGGGSGIYQDIDVSPAASLIDSGQVTYGVSAWLGGLGGVGPTLTYLFYDWSGKQLAGTAQLGPGTSSGGIVETSHSGTVPPGTRRVNIAVAFPNFNAVADDIAFTLAAPSAPPVISAAGVVSASAFGAFSSISPGSWIEIYGSYLAPSALNWSGFNSAGLAPTSLGGVSVTVGGQPAFLDYVSPSQVNALVPSNTPAGAQPVTVTNANGTSDKFWLIVNPTEPGLLSLSVGGKQYVAALFSDGVTYALPQNAITGVPSRPAMPGETVLMYGVGFGPVTGGFNAGSMVTGQNSLTTPIQFSFGTTQATLAYYGLAPGFTGLYQFNVVVPNLPVNAAQPISFTLGGAKGSQTLSIAVQ
jgi:uncharacterized protein (TIGR03437 family)